MFTKSHSYDLPKWNCKTGKAQKNELSLQMLQEQSVFKQSSK